MWFNIAKRTDATYIGNFLINLYDEILHKEAKKSSAKHIGNCLFEHWTKCSLNWPKKHVEKPKLFFFQTAPHTFLLEQFLKFLLVMATF